MEKSLTISSMILAILGTSLQGISAASEVIPQGSVSGSFGQGSPSYLRLVSTTVTVRRPLMRVSLLLNSHNDKMTRPMQSEVQFGN